ncbi:hypothetical protein PoB_005853700 [Plakobranchus ocellatus]|uniref:Uncharacterized protein n=1 Tax=Plakobranchus ocellatus TaxID=259542 RepID=A0AAV4CKG9_9GAST|nr:hypothetical protein PoB_005853700 [Plakobranchus ocellatus]
MLPRLLEKRNLVIFQGIDIKQNAMNNLFDSVDRKTNTMSLMQSFPNPPSGLLQPLMSKLQGGKCSPAPQPQSRINLLKESCLRMPSGIVHEIRINLRSATLHRLIVPQGFSSGRHHTHHR